MVKVKDAAARTPRLAILCGALLAACALTAAPSAQAASAPGLLAGTNTYDNHGGTIVTGYLDPKGSEITSCRFLYGLDESYGSEAPCEPGAAQIGDEVQRLLVRAVGGQFRFVTLREHDGTTGTGDLTQGSNVITNVNTSTGEFFVGEALRNEGDGPPGLEDTRITAVAPGTLEISNSATATKSATPLQADRLEFTAGLPFDASAAEVQAGLESVPAIGPGNVSVREGPGGYYMITFEGPFSHAAGPGFEVRNGSAPLVPVSAGAPTLNGETVAKGGLAVPVEVSADLQGLKPGAAYHFAIEATSAEGTNQSEDAPFVTPAEPEAESCPNPERPGAGVLGECRGWEMVSPPDKNGSNIVTFPERTRLADDGSAAGFTSLSGFADAIGSGVGFEYMSLRSSTPQPGDRGWSTHAIGPPEPPMSAETNFAGYETNYVEDFSPDLGRGVVQSYAPLSSDPAVAKIAGNLYLRSDLRSPGAGSYELVTACPLCAGAALAQLPYPARSKLIGGTPDLSHLLFESPYDLAQGATGKGIKLYEYDGSSVHLVGIAPGGTPFPESAAGSGKVLCCSFYTPPAISADGSKVFFTDKPGEGGDLYMRLGGSETVQLNVPEGVSGTTYAPATYWDESATGSRVFFTTSEKLTPDAPENEVKLYVYDTTKPASDPDNLTYIATVPGVSHESVTVASSYAVFGASADGSTVYFTVDPQHRPAGVRPYNELSLMVWQEGEVRFVDFLKAGGAGDASHSTYQDSFALGGKWTRVTPDGTLLFHSAKPIGAGGYDQGFGAPACQATYACSELYTYDPETRRLECASCDPSGQAATASAAVMTLDGRSSGQIANNHLNRPLSSDGRHVFFSSADALLPADTNGVSDAYAYDTLTGKVSLLSSGTSPKPSYFVEASPSGRDVLFTTYERLLGWDTDNNADLYDARIGGGFPEPAPAPAPCEGESCPGPSPQAGAPPSPASATLRVPGNPQVSRPKPCPKGTRAVNRHGKRRCVKARHHRAHHHHKKGARR